MESKKTYIIIGIIAIIIFIAITAVILLDGGNSKNEAENVSAENETNLTTTDQNTVDSENETDENTNSVKEDEAKVDYESAAKEQMADPKKGETIAVMHVKGYGDITFKFFDKKAPKAVENFLQHAKDGYYDGVKFHRVMEEFMIQGGDPKGDGTGGESIWGKGFEEEIDDTLVPYRGALCMASAGVGTSSLGSQFFIVQANYDESSAEYLTSQGYGEDLKEQYKKYGGNIVSLYKSYTVFGQVVKGMDVVDKIAKTKVKESDTGEMSVPVEDVIIESIDVKEQK